MRKEVDMKYRYFESTGRERYAPTPRMMEYLGHVIDLPTDNIRGKDTGKAPDEVIGEKMRVTRSRIGTLRHAIARFYNKEEVLELCEEVMKETA